MRACLRILRFCKQNKPAPVPQSRKLRSGFMGDVLAIPVVTSSRERCQRIVALFFDASARTFIASFNFAFASIYLVSTYSFAISRLVPPPVLKNTSVTKSSFILAERCTCVRKRRARSHDMTLTTFCRLLRRWDDTWCSSALLL